MEEDLSLSGFSDLWGPSQEPLNPGWISSQFPESKELWSCYHWIVSYKNTRLHPNPQYLQT